MKLTIEWTSMACVALAVICGCRQGPNAVLPPSVDAARAGKLAMQEYDTDGDGYVAGEELEKAPGLKAALANLDQDQDGRVSADEVEARVNSWRQSRVGLTTANCQIEMDGRPLAGVEVIFEPESFLGEDFLTAVGTTNRLGRASPLIPKEQRPSPDTPPGLALGLYKVKISKKVNGDEQIPSRYNTDTILGQEISFDDKAMVNNRIKFSLTSK